MSNQNTDDTEHELFGISLDPRTSTHGPCQVKDCDIEWTVSTSIAKLDSTKGDGVLLCLCSDHHLLFRELSEIDKDILEKYRDEGLISNERNDPTCNRCGHPRSEHAEDPRTLEPTKCPVKRESKQTPPQERRRSRSEQL